MTDFFFANSKMFATFMFWKSTNKCPENQHLGHFPDIHQISGYINKTGQIWRFNLTDADMKSSGHFGALCFG